MIKIRLKTTIDNDFIEIERPEPFILEDLVREYQDKLPYRVLLAGINGVERELTTEVNKDCRIEFFDMRSHNADLVYQRSCRCFI